MPAQSVAVEQGWASGSAGRGGAGSGRAQEPQSARTARRKMRKKALSDRDAPPADARAGRRQNFVPV